MRKAVVIPGLAGAAAVVLAVAFHIFGPDGGEPGSATYRSETGPVPETAQRPGDPEKGYRALVNEPYVSCGIPVSAYESIVGEEVATGRIPGREGPNADLPYQLTWNETAGGVGVVSNNCLTCHAGEIDGEVIVGLGNAFGDFTQDPRRLVLQSGSYVRGAAETAAWEHWADRIEGIAPYVRTRTVGANPAPNLTWALMAHLDPETLEWSEEPLIAPPPEDPLPISVPPWWGMRKKTAMFYTTIGRGDHARFMLLASMLCIDGTDDVAGIDAYAPDIRAYISTLEAPGYPYPIDRELAAAGAEIYVRDCAECHGTYGGEETYPNLVTPLGDIGTDPAYATEATNGERDRFYEWVARSPYGDTETAAPAPGYIAPPLDGVWATAPYLHNGSVPDMAALLASGERPRYWRHLRPKAYDEDRMGWRFEALEAGQSAIENADERRHVYDTDLRGYGNGGHDYSDGLGDAERRALIEYLKTL